MADERYTEVVKELIKSIQSDTEELKKESADKIPGGLSDNMSIEDIAKKHGVDVEYLQKQYADGIEVEKEHTDDIDMAKEIARDHLFEKPDYYELLKKYVEKD